MLAWLLVLGCLSRPTAESPEPGTVHEVHGPATVENVSPLGRPSHPGSPTVGAGTPSCVSACLTRRQGEQISERRMRASCMERCAGDAFLVLRGPDISMRNGTQVAVEGVFEVISHAGGRATVLDLEDGTRVWLENRPPPHAWRDLVGERVRIVGTLWDLPPRSPGADSRPLPAPAHMTDWDPPIRLRRPSLFDD